MTIAKSKFSRTSDALNEKSGNKSYYLGSMSNRRDDKNQLYLIKKQKITLLYKLQLIKSNRKEFLSYCFLLWTMIIKNIIMV